MRFSKPDYFTVGALTILIILVFLIGFNSTGSSVKVGDVNSTKVNAAQNQLKSINIATLHSQVVPSGGIILPGTWQNIGPLLVNSGAVDLDKFKEMYNSSGNPLREEQIAFLTKGTNEKIIMTKENSHFILNILWALGLTNKNNIFNKGIMKQYMDNGEAGNFASTGGWSLGKIPGGDLLNSAEIIVLNPQQQAIVEQVAKNTYRPCCNNPASFPDCNHGAAVLGLAELLAYQGATADQIAVAVKAANSMWFPQQYLELAVYFKAAENKDWNDVDPWMVLSREYSSSSGWLNIHTKLKEANMLPQVPASNGGCGVG